jgi:hypothetical protein
MQKKNLPTQAHQAQTIYTQPDGKTEKYGKVRKSKDLAPPGDEA